MKVTMLRKPEPYGLVPQDEIIIEQLIVLGEDEYDYLLRYPYQDYVFIAEHIDKMFIDDKEVWHVIAVWDKKHDRVLLINSEGSTYCRYATTVSIKELKDDIDRLIVEKKYVEQHWEERSEEEYDS